MKRSLKATLVGVCVVAVAGGGYGAYNVVHEATVASPTGSGGDDPAPAEQPPPSKADSVKSARSFLDDWAAGPSGYGDAAHDTDAPDVAEKALQDYHDGLKLSSVHFAGIVPAPVAAGALDLGNTTSVDFAVTAHVSGGTWSYKGSLQVVKNADGTAVVQWQPAVLYPQLQDGQQLKAGDLTGGATDITVTDEDGVALTAAKDPSLADILSQLKSRFADKAKDGSSDKGVEIVDAAGGSPTRIKTFSKGKPATLKTTLDAGLQKAAEKAVKDTAIGGDPSGVVAIDHSNGYVKAVAYSGDQGDIAINGFTAPGSTMKIITAAALIDKAGKGPATAASCPPTVEVNGQLFHNVDDEQATGATMQQAFEMSCNTAFIKLVDNSWEGPSGQSPEGFSAVGDEAHDVFGLGSWSIGVATHDPQVINPPVGDRNTRAADAIGQGNVAMSPLIMASVAATVRDEGFKQPILIPGLPQTPASKPISSTTAQDLQQMMRATAIGGTAAPRVGSLPGVGAKTGTAEVGSSTNGWFTAYDDNIAVAAEVIGGKTGVDSAGYLVRDVLEAGE